MANDDNRSLIQVEVAYAMPDEQLIIPVEVPEGATLEQVIIQSRIQERLPDVEISTIDVGIFGKISKRSATVRAGDRVELYRSLLADPKDVRKRRAAEGKQMRKGSTKPSN
ncbi:MAG: RnfH family protein [Candidatus Contendobacter odensis]|uniref:UPF0125 protein CSA09_05065 n=1 Tax=Candidatus Contendibacter odensensis TaxID=1400860 RepID=A0A2G6PE45_9GAMM|nr:MAG: RnfH family protein [Candidatus Contendobacter odensis]